jgi:hypothetical protein
MKILTYYHAASGTIVGRSIIADDATPKPGDYIEGDADPAAQYVTDDGLLATRIPAALTVDRDLLAADGVDAVTVTCPDSCWLRVKGEFVQAAGTYTITASAVTTIPVQLAGAHVGPTLTIKAGDAIQVALAADPRWQAMQAATPAQIDNWLAANVTTVAQARQVLRMLILAVRRLARE